MKIRNLLIIFAVLLLAWCVWSIDELDTRTYDLKNCIEEIQAKHNKLTGVVKGMYDGIFKTRN